MTNEPHDDTSRTIGTPPTVSLLLRRVLFSAVVDANAAGLSRRPLITIDRTRRVGELVSVHVIPGSTDETELVVPKNLTSGAAD